MTLTSTVLVLIAAVLHAVWNIAAKRVDGNSRVFVWCYGTASALLWLPIGLVLLARDGWQNLPLLLAASALSGVLHNVYGIVLNTGYGRAQLGIVYPTARGAGPLIAMAFALLVLGEEVAWHNALGGLVVIAGVGIVASSGQSLRGGSRSGALGVRWGIYTGVTIAAYTLWDGYAVTELALNPVTFFAFYAAWQSITLAPMLRNRTRRVEVRTMVRRHLKEILLIGVLSPLGYILVLIAMQSAPIALVAPARESSIVVGVLLAWWIFKEPAPAPKLAGSAVVVVGIALISF